MVDIQDAAYWRSCELWSLREAAYLLTGSEPRSEAEFRTQDRDAQSPVARTYRGLKDSTLAGSLAFKELDGIIDRRRITPRDAVTWAVRKGMEVSAVLAPLAAGTEDSPADEPPAPETRASSDDDALAALFDAVTVSQLAAMFPTSPDGGSSLQQWKQWAERAARNGLNAAREGRGKFNPYRAAQWFIGQGVLTWDWAKCMRKLAHNLPPRSLDSRHLLGVED